MSTASTEALLESLSRIVLAPQGGPVRAVVSPLGATLVELWAPDRDGTLADLTLGFDDDSGYRSPDNQHFGCTTGRFANRIAGGRFRLEGKEYRLAVNNGPNHLHGGGERSLSKVTWKHGPTEQSAAASAVTFSYLSPDGEEGYPGNLKVEVKYTVTVAGELLIDYTAVSDASTPVNLTNHAYWNLSGHGSPSLDQHYLEIAADKYTPVNNDMIPTGVIAPVQDTALDFRSAKPVLADIAAVDGDPTHGYDHNFVLRGESGTLRSAAQLSDRRSGRVMQILTTEPAIQLYTGNFLRGQHGKGSAVYRRRSALCLEAQHYPDSVNRPDFPDVILRPGSVYTQRTVHVFSVN